MQVQDRVGILQVCDVQVQDRVDSGAARCSGARWWGVLGIGTIRRSWTAGISRGRRNPAGLDRGVS